MKTGHFTLVREYAVMQQRADQPQPPTAAAEQTRRETTESSSAVTDDLLQSAPDKSAGHGLLRSGTSRHRRRNTAASKGLTRSPSRRD